MTLPSTPNLPVLFPDQANALNFFGYRPPTRPIARITEFYASNIDAGNVHNNFRDQQIKLLLDARQNNKRKELLMRGMIPSSLTFTARKLNAMCGGVAKTNEGRKLIDERLAQRKIQYANLSTAGFDTPAPPGSSVLPPLTPDVTASYDDAMISLADSVQTGYVDRNLLDNLAKANSALISIGALLEPSQIAEYMRGLNTLTSSVEGLIETAQTSGPNSAGFSAGSRKTLETLLLGLRRQYTIFEMLNRKVNESPTIKQKLLLMEQGRKLPTEVSTILRQGGPRPLVVTAESEPVAGESQQATRRRAAAQTWVERIRNGTLPDSFAPHPDHA